MGNSMCLGGARGEVEDGKQSTPVPVEKNPERPASTIWNKVLDVHSEKLGEAGQEQMSVITPDEDEEENAGVGPIKETRRRFQDIQSVKVGGVEEMETEKITNLISEFESVAVNAKSKRVRGGTEPLAEIGFSKEESVKNFSRMAQLFKRQELATSFVSDNSSANEQKSSAGLGNLSSASLANSMDLFDMSMTSEWNDKSRTSPAIETFPSKDKFLQLTNRFQANLSQVDVDTKVVTLAPSQSSMISFMTQSDADTSGTSSMCS